MLNRIQRQSQNTIYYDTITLNLSLFVLYSNLMGLIVPQNMFNMFPQIPSVKDIASENSNMDILQPPFRILYIIYINGYLF